jgi:hypothetical protein
VGSLAERFSAPREFAATRQKVLAFSGKDETTAVTIKQRYA